MRGSSAVKSNSTVVVQMNGMEALASNVHRWPSSSSIFDSYQWVTNGLRLLRYLIVGENVRSRRLQSAGVRDSPQEVCFNQGSWVSDKVDAQAQIFCFGQVAAGDG